MATRKEPEDDKKLDAEGDKPDNLLPEAQAESPVTPLITFLEQSTKQLRELFAIERDSESPAYIALSTALFEQAVDMCLEILDGAALAPATTASAEETANSFATMARDSLTALSNFYIDLVHKESGVASLITLLSGLRTLPHLDLAILYPIFRQIVNDTFPDLSEEEFDKPAEPSEPYKARLLHNAISLACQTETSPSNPIEVNKGEILTYLIHSYLNCFPYPQVDLDIPVLRDEIARECASLVLRSGPLHQSEIASNIQRLQKLLDSARLTVNWVFEGTQGEGTAKWSICYTNKKIIVRGQLSGSRLCSIERVILAAADLRLLPQDITLLRNGKNITQICYEGLKDREATTLGRKDLKELMNYWYVTLPDPDEIREFNTAAMQIEDSQGGEPIAQQVNISLGSHELGATLSVQTDTLGRPGVITLRTLLPTLEWPHDGRVIEYANVKLELECHIRYMPDPVHAVIGEVTIRTRYPSRGASIGPRTFSVTVDQNKDMEVITGTRPSGGITNPQLIVDLATQLLQIYQDGHGSLALPDSTDLSLLEAEEERALLPFSKSRR